MRTASLLLSVLFFACGSESDGASDAGPPAAVDGGTADAAGGDLQNTCVGDCSAMDLTIDFGGVSESFDRAFFGLTSPAESASGGWEIYIENNSGDDDQCPTESSPTPRFLMTVAGLALPSAGEFPGELTLVDFEGALLPDSVFEKASVSTVTWIAADICLACSEGSEADRPDRMVALDIDATFSQGSIRGHSYATHCPSLDQI